MHDVMHKDYNTHDHMVYVTDTAAPKKEGKHNMDVKTVDIWLDRHGFLDGW